MSASAPWIWAVGFENTFIAQTARGERVLDEYEITQHYRFWREDLERVRQTGATMIRYGIPWYKVEPESGVYDWEWTDEVMAYFAEHRDLKPIIDLMHYGTPLWMDREFMNAAYPEYVARYATAFAQRYSSIVAYYTPLNEPFINSEWCGWSGTWPPYLKGHDGFVSIMNQLCKGIIRTVTGIREIQPDSTMIHVEAAKKFVAADESLIEETKLWNEIRYVMWELVQGNVEGDHPLRNWLIRNGVSEADLSWYLEHAIELDVVGINFYPQFSVNAIDKEVVRQQKIPQPVHGGKQDLVEIVRDINGKYGKPVFITETSYWGSEEERIAWLEDVIDAGRQLTSEGIELAGITWFPFLDMVDWPYRTNGLPFRDNVATFGLYTLEEQPDGTLARRKNAVCDRFEQEVQGRSKI
ncbi:family 1 glycosylhydrolase [Cohnella silvisoli]|uniref:Family 1 glycosylhydrolase n=1 Tax=Cohnella silvisoli TaxID=2873699 RepID=A0ABV1KN03_9BACL|nr:family 1 glycosylhydrolase [Cohnella silvisoli]MCD9020832.1 family 1 glycosylhydrolase [Cohnella silvisoli]